MDADVRIEKPEMEEADALADLWVDLAREQRAYGSHLLPAANRSAIHDAIAHHVVVDGILVARADDATVLGFVMFGPVSGSYEEDVSRGVVRNLFVRPGHRDEGVGTTLLAAAEDALAGEGFSVVTLEAMAANDDAVRFYRRHGYETTRVEMEKRLDAGDADDEDDPGSG